MGNNRLHPPSAHGLERRPPARHGTATILEHAVPEAGAPMLWFSRAQCAKSSKSSPLAGEGKWSSVSSPIERELKPKSATRRWQERREHWLTRRVMLFPQPEGDGQ